jgi:uncharacterized membrane protein YuzA (DUF378 family)
MNDTQRLAALRIVLIVVGLIAVFAIWPLMRSCGLPVGRGTAAIRTTR